MIINKKEKLDSYGKQNNKNKCINKTIKLLI